MDSVPNSTSRIEEMAIIDLNEERDPLPLPRSRPLSEISDNSVKFNRRTSNGIVNSRPNSEVREDTKRLSSVSGLEGIKTITLNLNDYAGSSGSGGGVKSPTSTVSSIGREGPPPPSPTTKPGSRPALPSRRSTMGKDKAEDGENIPSTSGTSANEDTHISPLLVSKRLSLRPSPLSASYADVAKPSPSPPASISSLDSSTSIPELPPKPVARTKPSWLRRASGNNALRSKSKSPSPAEDVATLPTSSSLPPDLPPRKGKGLENLPEMGPPDMPRRSSYANVTATAGPSRSRLGDGQGRPAFLPAPPPLPSRENVGNIRTRLAAWTSAAAQSSGSSFSRSESSNSIASTASTQRIPASAQRVLGHAGSAVQKGWAGLRSRGVGGSISSMSALGGSSGRKGSLEPSPSWSSGLNRRGSRDRTQSETNDLRHFADGPVFQEGCFKRQARSKGGRVFGRELKDAARTWGIEGANEQVEGMSEYEQRRRASLPAVVIRTVEYLEIWGPKEEGIFRISGRTSHLSRLRKEFDAGADIDLKGCHPADLDPHAVAGIFKSYLRELPSPLLTNELTPEFESYVRQRSPSSDKVPDQDELVRLLQRLPISHWFLLADIVKLLILIPQHVDANRMTLNALMLSLGPSLNISGGVINELLERQEELFSKPPLAHDETIDLIDFGDVDIEPPTIPSAAVSISSRSVTPISTRSEDSTMVQLLNNDATPKKKPSLPKKPSLSRLLTVAAGAKSASRTASMETLQTLAPVVNVTPPRVEVAIEETSPLPTFEDTVPFAKFQDHAPTSQIEANDRESNVTVDSSLDTRRRPSLAPTSSSGEPTTPTPIADRFSKFGLDFPSLRSTTSSSVAFNAVLGEPINTISGPVRKRGGASGTFFSASLASASEKGSRSQSTSPAAVGRLSSEDKKDGEEVLEELRV